MNANKGSILIETLTAVVILTVSLSVIMHSMLNSYRSLSLQKEYTQALTLLENQISKTFFDPLRVNNPSPERISKFEYLTKTTPRDGLLHNASTHITWSAGRGQRQVSVNFLVYAKN